MTWGVQFYPAGTQFRITDDIYTGDSRKLLPGQDLAAWAACDTALPCLCVGTRRAYHYRLKEGQNWYVERLLDAAGVGRATFLVTTKYGVMVLATGEVRMIRTLADVPREVRQELVARIALGV